MRTVIWKVVVSMEIISVGMFYSYERVLTAGLWEVNATAPVTAERRIASFICLRKRNRKKRVLL